MEATIVCWGYIGCLGFRIFLFLNHTLNPKPQTLNSERTNPSKTPHQHSVTAGGLQVPPGRHSPLPLQGNGDLRRNLGA